VRGVSLAGAGHTSRVGSGRETAERSVPGGERKADRGSRLAALLRRPSVLIGGAIALAIVFGVVIWLISRAGSDEPAPERAQASAASIRRLNELASSIGHPVYWAGPQPRFVYELSRTKDGRVYIRYLPPNAEVGDRTPNYLTVGTYPQRNALATLRATAAKQQARTIRLVGGGLAFQDTNRPSSVYLAYPRSDYQVEVYAPSPGTARALVAAGQIKALGAPPPSPAARAASIDELKRLAASLAHPIYWAGPTPGTTYELTRTRDESVYIRYLPPGIDVGARRPDYLTIGTYPLENALEKLRAAAAPSVETIEVDDGGVAFVDRKHPTSVYVAYPGADVQIEVYDAAPRRARQLVTSGRIVAIR
jgi:hypothetical protein